MTNGKRKGKRTISVKESKPNKKGETRRAHPREIDDRNREMTPETTADDLAGFAVATEADIKNRDARTADLAERMRDMDYGGGTVNPAYIDELETGIAECETAYEADVFLAHNFTVTQINFYGDHIAGLANSSFFSEREHKDGVIQYDTSTADDVYEAELMKAFQHVEKSRGIPDGTFDFANWRKQHATAYENSVKCHNEVVKRAVERGCDKDFAESDATRRIMLRLRSPDPTEDHYQSAMATDYNQHVDEVTELVVGEYEIMMGDIAIGKS